MKNMKKIVALVIAMMLVCAMAYTAFAATITIKQTAPAASGTVGAETYNLYKIFDVKKTSEQSGTWQQTDDNIGAGVEEGFAYTISTSNPWFNVLGSVSEGTWSAASGQTWVTLTPSAGDNTTYNVTWAGANTEAAAKEFAAWLQKNMGSIDADETLTSSSGTATKTTVADGYYMITSSLGTNLVLATSDIEISTKNQYVTDDKTVAKTNWNVGDHVEYTITVNLPASIDYKKPVVIHDTLDGVLAFDNNVTAKLGSDDFTAFTVNTNPSDECTFEITLNITGLAPSGTTPEAKTIVFTYTAELLEAAAADTGYVNEEFTEYSEYKTKPNDVEVKTYDFDLVKEFTGAASGTTDLVATFNLYATSGSSKVKLNLIEEAIYEKYVKADSKNPSSGTATDTISVQIGKKLNVRGLAEGNYYLTELTTADGYNLLTDDIVVNIDGSGTVSVSNAGDLFRAASGTVTVVNNSGTVLPSTGGMGTTILYIAGAILVLGAGILLVTRRRSNY